MHLHGSRVLLTQVKTQVYVAIKSVYNFYSASASLQRQRSLLHVTHWNSLECMLRKENEPANGSITCLHGKETNHRILQKKHIYITDIKPQAAGTHFADIAVERLCRIYNAACELIKMTHYNRNTSNVHQTTQLISVKINGLRSTINCSVILSFVIICRKHTQNIWKWMHSFGNVYRQNIQRHVSYLHTPYLWGLLSTQAVQYNKYD